jgi:2-polyprenyl-3-methyl-5-hydroxy-6-metoxy-1,4-benzoquinol methylase
MSTQASTYDPVARDRDDFSERLFGEALGTFNIFSVYIGDRLGFYRALAGGEALTSGELARRTNTHERYVREWLEHQATSCVLEADRNASGAGNGSGERRYSLPPGRAEVLADRESLNFMAPLAQLIVGAVSPLEALLDAYRNGGGVAYHVYGIDLREGQAAMNRQMFLQQLGYEWLPRVEDVNARLQANPPAQVADIGCGAGWSSIGIARAYPQVRVDGYDLDPASVELARANIHTMGLSERVKVYLQDASDPELAGSYDLVTAFECLHDMSNPVGALKTMRSLAGERGAVIIMDERAMETFQPCGEALDQLLYGFSILHCLPAGMVEQPSAATGTVMRPDTLRKYAQEAGFSQLEILPIDNFFFRFYRLRP